MSEQLDTTEESAAGSAGEDRGVGEVLAQARQEQGYSLDDIANQLKFSTRQIDALESGRFEQLPGRPFVRGMVRSYARLLNLDPAALLARLGGEPGVTDPNRIIARFQQPVPFSDATKRSSLIYVILSVLLLAVAAIAFLQWRQERTRPAAQTVQVPVPLNHARSGARNAPKPPAAPAPAAEAPPQPSPPAAQAQVTPPPVSLGRQTVGLRLDDESWIEIKDVYGRVLVSQLLPAGTERTVAGEAPLSIVIGNAHHVELTHNGHLVDLQPYIKVEVARLTLK